MVFKIGITMGDPKGVGPEVLAKSWGKLNAKERLSFEIYGDMGILSSAATLAKTEFDHKLLTITSSTSERPSKLEDREAARITVQAIDAAMNDALSGKISAIVTAPINKKRMKLIKKDFSGHTEYLAKFAKVKDPVMMFAPDDFMEKNGEEEKKSFCISLVTMHLPIKKVPKAITMGNVLSAIRRTSTALEEYFGRKDARIGVMSLNPHGGEKGSLGNEEEKAIIPAIRRAVKEGINCVGPLAADGLFRNIKDIDFDALIAMYHDQGLIPVKLLCQGTCVNITLGLPYVRTSPGHGTAEDIAWLGNADESGMLAAMKLAKRLAGEPRSSRL